MLVRRGVAVGTGRVWVRAAWRVIVNASAVARSGVGVKVRVGRRAEEALPTTNGVGVEVIVMVIVKVSATVAVDSGVGETLSGLHATKRYMTRITNSSTVPRRTIT